MSRTMQRRKITSQSVYEECRKKGFQETCEELRKRGYKEEQISKTVGELIQNFNEIERLEGEHRADKIRSIIKDSKRNPEIIKSIFKDLKKKGLFKS